MEGRSGSFRQNSAFRVFPLRRRSARLCGCILRDDGGHAAAGHDSTEIPSRGRVGASHRTLRVGYAASEAWHSRDPTSPNGIDKTPLRDGVTISRNYSAPRLLTHQANRYILYFSTDLLAAVGGRMHFHSS